MKNKSEKVSCETKKREWTKERQREIYMAEKERDSENGEHDMIIKVDNLKRFAFKSWHLIVEISIGRTEMVSN